MSLSELQGSTQWNEKVSIFVSHLLVALMLTCVTITLVQFGEFLFPGWQGGFFPWVIFVVALEAMYTKRSARNLSIFSLEWVVYRGVELVVLFLGLKIFLYLLREPARLWADLATWQQDFLNNFFRGEYLIASALVFLFWITASQFAEDLADLEGDDKLIEGVYPVNASAERSQVRKGLVDRIIVYGAGMVVLVSVMRIDLESFLGFRPIMRSTIINVLAYFVLALALLSQTQFAILRASWSTQRISLHIKLGSRWVIYSLVFLIGLAVLAIFLPTSYTVGLLSILGFLLSILLFVVTLAGHLLLTLFFLILSLFGGDQTAPGTTPSLPPPSTSSPLNGGGFPPWFELIKSVLFWVTFLGVIGFSIYQYAKQHESLWESLRRLPGLAILRKVLQWLRESFKGVNRVASSVVADSWRRVRRVGTVTPWKEARSLINLRKLSNRQKVLFYYLAMVRRGEEYGLRRQPSQTPQEYQIKLQSSLPEIDQDLAAMTDAFYKARYSQHEIGEDQAGWVARLWVRIRRTLRSWKKGGQRGK